MAADEPVEEDEGTVSESGVTENDSPKAEADSNAEPAADSEKAAAPAEPEPEPEPEATQQVHLYEHGQFLRTLDRVFTEDEANAFVKMYSETSKHYGRKAFATMVDDKPPESLL